MGFDKQIRGLIVSLCLSMGLAEFCAETSQAQISSAKIDSSSYMKKVSAKIKKLWVPVSQKEDHVVAQWTIHPNGAISNLKITKHASNKDDERRVVKAINAAAPFDALPTGSENIQIEFAFDYLKGAPPLGLTVAQALKKYGPDAKKRILPYLKNAEVDYPPKQIELVCLKDSNQLFVFARDGRGNRKKVKTYTLVSRSGEQGPKIKEGDLQVPEGFYKITALDAMTHLAMWVNYPNRADMAHAKLDHRTNLGGYIQIHAGVFSTGCLVLNSDDMAELMLLGNETGCRNIALIIAPCNLLLKKPDVDLGKQPKWLPELYKELKTALADFPIQDADT